MTRDQIQKRIEMIIEEEFFKYQDSLAVQRSAKRIMKEWDNGFVYEIKDTDNEDWPDQQYWYERVTKGLDKS